jgi:hypothetical protein
VVNRNASNDIFTWVGHTPSRLTCKGKKWEKHESVPMLWISCHHSVRLVPDQRTRSTGKGNPKGKHNGKDKGKAKGKGKHKDHNKDNAKSKGKGNHKHHDKGKAKDKFKHKDQDKG